MTQPSLGIANALWGRASRTVSGRDYTSADSDTTSRILADCRESDKNNGVLFQYGRAPKYCRLRPLVEVRAQFVDRGEAHHAFRHLGLDRAVRVERIGHAVDDPRLQHRHRRLIAIPRRGAIGLRRRRRPSAAPLRRNVTLPPALRLGPGIVE